MNVGIYRQQVLSRNRLIMRWLSHPFLDLMAVDKKD